MIRLAGYACGVAGALIMLHGRRMTPTPDWTRYTGFALMILMVTLFVVAHTIQLIGRLTHPSPGRRRGAPEGDDKNPSSRR